MLLFSCNIAVYTQSYSTPNHDIFCDSSKVRDFKENLIDTQKLIPENIASAAFSQANTILDSAIVHNSIYRNQLVFLKTEHYYQYGKKWAIYLGGYRLQNFATDTFSFDSGFVSLYVMRIYKEGQLFFADFQEDMMGEIAMDLRGLEETMDGLTVWGQLYPYFNHDYGRFRLSIKNGTGTYEFQCHSIH